MLYTYLVLMVHPVEYVTDIGKDLAESISAVLSFFCFSKKCHIDIELGKHLTGRKLNLWIFAAEAIVLIP